MSIDYEVTLNKLTTPASYSARVKPKNTVVLDDLLTAISASCTLAPSDVAATVMNFITQVKSELLKGNSVHIDGLATFGTSISAKMATPTSDLPVDYQVKVNVNASRGLLDEVRDAANVTRISAPSLAPDLLTLTAVTGTLTSLLVNNTLTLEGDRLSFDPSHNDEGVFFVKVSDGTAVR
ncbi:MAG: hypothetical protein WCO51_11070, partial [bacterium]